jgi:hypothetical protein
MDTHKNAIDYYIHVFYVYDSPELNLRETIMDKWN